jgi:hypothetical protein
MWRVPRENTQLSTRPRERERSMKTKKGFVENEPNINWIKNDPDKHKFFTDGSVFLVALQVRNIKNKTTQWEFDVVRTDCDGEGMHLTQKCGCSYDDWSWDDFEYFKLLDGNLPTFDIEELK